jgi:hypothetical protein
MSTRVIDLKSLLLDFVGTAFLIANITAIVALFLKRAVLSFVTRLTMWAVQTAWWNLPPGYWQLLVPWAALGMCSVTVGMFYNAAIGGIMLGSSGLFLVVCVVVKNTIDHVRDR